MTKTFYPFLIIVLSLFILMCAPTLFTEGMFMDGLMYAVVSKNLAHGEGSFWFLKFSDTYLTSFHEHPPLIFGLQSLCFNLFGDSIFVERFFSFFTYIFSGTVMIFILKEIMPSKYQSIAWFSLLLWIAMPLTSWGAVNNMLENGMLVFILLSVLFFIKSLSKNRITFLALSSLMLFFAFLSKGFTGLFPLAFPFAMWCFDKEYNVKKALIDTLLLLGFLMLFFLFLFLFQEDSLPSLKAYFDIQVKKSLQDIVTVDSRFFIVGKLFTELLISFVLLLLIFLLGRKQKTAAVDVKWFYILLTLGLCGVLPIMLSLKQNAHYLLCALPFFALAFTVLIATYLIPFVDKIHLKNKMLSYTSTLFFVIAALTAYTQKGEYSRDENTIHDVKEIVKILPPHTAIAVSKNDFSNWALQGYMYRYATISLSADSVKYSQYRWIKKGQVISAKYCLVPLSSEEHDLLQNRYGQPSK